MKVCIDGKYVERIPDEIAELEAMQVKPDYKESVISAIREKYSVDDELAILRQRDTKPEEFAEYFKFVENIKQNLKENDSTENWHEITDEEAFNEYGIEL
jgi:hypothetical protein